MHMRLVRRAVALTLLLALMLLAPAACAGEANVYLFDMGSADSPVWPGFAQVTLETSYAAERGYGWLGEAEGMRAHVASNIDALAIDDISGLGNRTGTFQVDVPDGEYTVWVLSGAMGNIWRLRYLRAPHALLVQGEVARTIDYPEEKLFEVADYDWQQGDDIWEVFIEPRFEWLRHEAAATEGKLVLGFQDHAGFPVNAVVVAAQDVSERVGREIGRIDDLRREAFYGFWQEQRPEPEPQADVSAEERQRGYLVAEAHCSDDTRPWSQPAPGASRERIELFATPGEQEQASFAVYALRDLEDVTFALGEMRAENGATLPAEAFQPGLVQFAPWHAGRRDAPTFAIRECLILPLRPTFIGDGTCKRFWITLNTPPDAAPGVYEGRITISARNAPPSSMDLRARVVPVTLETPPVERYMYFGTMYYQGRAYLPDFDPERFWEAMRAEVRFMRDNQYCRAECIIPRGSGAVKIEDGRVVDVDLDDTAKLMQILREEDAWPRDNAMICRTGGLNILFGGHFHRPDNPGVEFIPTEEGREHYAQAIGLIDERAKAEGWPEVAFECLGEFSNYGEQGKQFAIEVHTLLHDLGVANTIRGNGPSDMAAIERGLVKYPQPNHAMMHAGELEIMHRTGERLWAYNFTRSRFSMGWFCFKHGITRASYESGVYANGQPGNLFDIETMPPMGLPTSMTTIEPTVWLKRLVQGAVDYEYLWNLDRLITEAEQSGRAEAAAKAREARTWLDGKLAELPDEVDYIAGDPKADLDVQGAFWPVHDLDRYRWQVAQFIMEINQALGREG
ncbi:MAG: hypothetical protein U9R79_11270 [Armatimonadota bacterium]|nr:hypothetical protein [Armatimonadota bacterium]